MRINDKYLIKNLKKSNGIQKIYRFENNYGASVIKTTGSYGHEKGLWELAVIFFTDREHYELCYETDITDDVIGYLILDEVDRILSKIKKIV